MDQVNSPKDAGNPASQRMIEDLKKTRAKSKLAQQEKASAEAAAKQASQKPLVEDKVSLSSQAVQKSQDEEKGKTLSAPAYVPASSHLPGKEAVQHHVQKASEGGADEAPVPQVITITPEQLAEMKAQAKLKRMPDGAAIAEASQTPEAKLAAHRAQMEFFAANRPKIAIDHRNGFYPPPEVKTRPTPAPQKVRAKPEVVVDESGESSLE